MRPVNRLQGLAQIPVRSTLRGRHTLLRGEHNGEVQANGMMSQAGVSYPTRTRLWLRETAMGFLIVLKSEFLPLISTYSQPVGRE